MQFTIRMYCDDELWYTQSGTVPLVYPRAGEKVRMKTSTGLTPMATVVEVSHIYHNDGVDTRVELEL